ncbi:MAG: hypothetical protein CFE37_10215 [Alphaproteobacteria bacterium PA4]|nr:MAG: hypothetical protein CFE37_10215 [Alphaproteobacteria bacterium PA4]
MKTVFASLLLLSATAVSAAPIPDAVAAMLEAASGDAAQLKVVADIAKKTNPGSAAEIDAKVAGYTKAQAEAREAKLAAQGFTQGWTGSGEIGANVSSGNTENRGVAVGITLGKETRSWKHQLRGLVDYQEQNGVKSRERYFAGYEGNYNITPRLYALLPLAYEKDRFSGFNSRFAESIGLGYKLFDSPKLRLGLEAGPAFRQTKFTNGVQDNTFAARGAGNFWWGISSGLELTENATVFYDSFNTSVQSLTALTAKLNSKLSARASFQLNTESNPPLGRETSDTISRLTLVYGF